MGDDVEIGANTCRRPRRAEDTTLGDGVKLDNQIMIAHNVRIGAHTAMAACVGVARLDRRSARAAPSAGASMLSGHLTLGDDVHISGGTAVTSDIDKPGQYTGVYPYAEHAQWQRNAAVIRSCRSCAAASRRWKRRRARARRPERAVRGPARGPLLILILERSSSRFLEHAGKARHGTRHQGDRRSACRIATRCCSSTGCWKWCRASPWSPSRTCRSTSRSSPATSRTTR